MARGAEPSGMVTGASRRGTWAWSLGAGLALGTYSAAADRIPPDLGVLAAMGNAAGPWLAAAFLVGALHRQSRRGAAAGAVALAMAVLAYYAALGLSGEAPPSGFLARAALAWLAVAIVAGPVMGAAGGAWAAFRDRRRIVAVAMLAGGLLAEAAQGFIAVEAWTGIDLGRTALQVALVDALAAAALPILLLRPPQRLAAYGTSVLVGAGGLAVLRLLLAAVTGFMHG